MIEGMRGDSAETDSASSKNKANLLVNFLCIVILTTVCGIKTVSVPRWLGNADCYVV